MSEDLVAVRDLAKQLGRQKAHLFKVLKRLGIKSVKERDASAKGQAIARISAEDARRVTEALSTIDDQLSGVGVPLETSGVFYLIQLEPELDASRFKLGFASSMPERLRQLRCSAPFAKVLKSWPCKLVWERTAIDSVTQGCERVHTEVFRAPSLTEIEARCEAFFALMPRASS